MNKCDNGVVNWWE